MIPTSSIPHIDPSLGPVLVSMDTSSDEEDVELANHEPYPSELTNSPLNDTSLICTSNPPSLFTRTAHPFSFKSSPHQTFKAFSYQAIKAIGVCSVIFELMDEAFNEREEFVTPESEMKLEEILLRFNNGSLVPLNLRKWNLMPCGQKWLSFLGILNEKFLLEAGQSRLLKPFEVHSLTLDSLARLYKVKVELLEFLEKAEQHMAKVKADLDIDAPGHPKWEALIQLLRERLQYDLREESSATKELCFEELSFWRWNEICSRQNDIKQYAAYQERSRINHLAIVIDYIAQRLEGGSGEINPAGRAHHIGKYYGELGEKNKAKENSLLQQLTALEAEERLLKATAPRQDDLTSLSQRLDTTRKELAKASKAVDDCHCNINLSNQLQQVVRISRYHPGPHFGYRSPIEELFDLLISCRDNMSQNSSGHFALMISHGHAPKNQGKYHSLYFSAKAPFLFINPHGWRGECDDYTQLIEALTLHLVTKYDTCAVRAVEFEKARSIALR